jgi:acyl carrier protein
MDEQAFLSKLAAALRLEPGTVQPDSGFSPDVWDSLAVMEAIALIDEHAGITVPAQALSQCRSVAELLALIRSNTAG